MTGAEEARQSIAAAAERWHYEIKERGAAYSAAYRRVAESADLDDARLAAVELIVAAEAMQERLGLAAEGLRAVLAAVMFETGATTIRGAHLSAHISKRPQRVEIVNRDWLPPEFLETPPPRPNLPAIAKAIRAGQGVAGARLIGNGEPMLVIRTKEAA